MRVLIIEDNPKMAEAMQKGLRDRDIEVDVAHSGAEGERMGTSGEYDVIVLDVMLPDRDGVELCRDLRRAGVRSRILMLTALNTTDQKITGLDSGADDYMTKPFEFDELVARTKALARRTEGVEVRSLKFENLELDLFTRSAKRGDQRIELSNREYGLLEYFMKAPNRVLSRAQIGEAVWDMNFEAESNVIDVFVSSLRRKVDHGHSPKLIHTVKGRGYQFGIVDEA
jgi:DNA-binding response OmpR family regulator